MRKFAHAQPSRYKDLSHIYPSFGFRYWKDPGAFATSITGGALGRFEGFLGALFQGAFTIVGPEYLSIVAGETKYPRKYLKQAFK